MPSQPIQIAAYCATDIITSEGVMKGATISFADELVLDDAFQVQPRAAMRALSLRTQRGGLVRADTGAVIHLDCCLTLMAPDGETSEAIVLVEVAAQTAVAIFVLPLGEMLPFVDYRLVGLSRHTATKRFAEATCGSFARGTRITLGDGTMRPIEALDPGDMVLTRDAGRQPIVDIGQATLRAKGCFAPVVITKGALHNDQDLIVRPDHRLFIYQRTDQLQIGRSEVLIKARHLVDGKTVLRRRGGFIDYFQLVFADQHIIYAEGIAAESHFGSAGDDPSDARAGALHHTYEVADTLLPKSQASTLLRKASTG